MPFATGLALAAACFRSAYYRTCSQPPPARQESHRHRAPGVQQHLCWSNSWFVPSREYLQSQRVGVRPCRQHNIALFRRLLRRYRKQTFRRFLKNLLMLLSHSYPFASLLAIATAGCLRDTKTLHSTLMISTQVQCDMVMLSCSRRAVFKKIASFKLGQPNTESHMYSHSCSANRNLSMVQRNVEMNCLVNTRLSLILITRIGQHLHRSAPRQLLHQCLSN